MYLAPRADSFADPLITGSSQGSTGSAYLMQKLNIKTAQIEFHVENSKCSFKVEKFDETNNLVDTVTYNCYTEAEQEYHNWCGTSNL